MSSAAVALTAAESSAAHHRDQIFESAISFGILALVLFGPVAFGAVEPWAIFTLEAGAVLLFLAWAAKQLIHGEVKVVGNPTLASIIAFAALVAFQIAAGRTAYREATITAALLFASYALLCFLTVQTFRRISQVKVAGITFSVYGSLIALFAIVQSLAYNGKLYWVRTPRFGGWIYGPYVNHNHYAGLMELLTPIPIVIFLSARVRGKYKVLAGMAAALMASSIFLSGSRGGVLAFAAQIVVLAAFRFRRADSRRTAIELGVLAVVAAAMLVWLGNSELLGRVTGIPAATHAEISDGTRLNIDRDCVRMFFRKPVIGWGLGTFSVVYPQFRSFYTDFKIDHAHNDYLEFLLETGAIGFCVILWFLVSVYRSGFKKLNGSGAGTNTEVAVASLVGITGILVHSCVDFNLQIPANMALFLILCTIAAGPAFEKRRHTDRLAS